jgi:hypothetical protein
MGKTASGMAAVVAGEVSKKFPGHEVLLATLKGVRPLIVHNVRLADPMDPYARGIAAINAKGSKKITEKDAEERQRLEFIGGLYTEPEIGPVIPGQVFMGLLKSAAKNLQRGLQMDMRGGVVIPDPMKILYEGPRDPEKLWALQAFRFLVPVRVKQSKVMRMRPIFRSWSLDLELHYEPRRIGRDTMVKLLSTAGDLGLCEHRPEFGRFMVELKN